MKKNQLAKTTLTTVEKLQKTENRKKKEERSICNHFLLFKEFCAIGLPHVMDENALYRLLTLSGEEWVLDLDLPVCGIPVNVRVHLEADGPNDMYIISYYELVLKNLSDGQSGPYCFPATILCFITIEEAVNLLVGRCIYRKPEVDPLREGCWLFLRPAELKPGIQRPFPMRNGFNVRESLMETGLGCWLGLEGFNKLVADLEKGNQCDLAIGTGKGMRRVKVEADPFGECLKVTNAKGVKACIG